MTLFLATGTAAAECQDLGPGVRRWKKKCRMDETCVLVGAICRDSADRCEGFRKKQCKRNSGCIWGGPRGPRTKAKRGTCSPTSNTCEGLQLKKLCKNASCKWSKKSKSCSSKTGKSKICGMSFSEYDTDGDGRVSLDELYRREDLSHNRCLGTHLRYVHAVASVAGAGSGRSPQSGVQECGKGKPCLVTTQTCNPDGTITTESVEALNLDESAFDALANSVYNRGVQESKCGGNQTLEETVYFGRTIYLPKTDVLSLWEPDKDTGTSPLLFPFLDLSKNSSCYPVLPYAGKESPSCAAKIVSVFSDFETSSEMVSSVTKAVQASGSYSSKLFGISASAEANYKTDSSSTTSSTFAALELTTDLLVSGYKLSPVCQNGDSFATLLDPTWRANFEKLPLPHQSSKLGGSFPALSMAWRQWHDAEQGDLTLVGKGNVRCDGPDVPVGSRRCPSHTEIENKYGSYFLRSSGLREGYLNFLENFGSHVIVVEEFGFSYRRFSTMTHTGATTENCMNAGVCATLQSVVGEMSACASVDECTGATERVSNIITTTSQSGGQVVQNASDANLCVTANAVLDGTEKAGTTSVNIVPVWDLLKDMYQKACESSPFRSYYVSDEAIAQAKALYNASGAGTPTCSEMCRSNIFCELSDAAKKVPGENNLNSCTAMDDWGSRNVGEWNSGAQPSAVCSSNRYNDKEMGCNKEPIKHPENSDEGCKCTFQSNDRPACMNLQRAKLLEATFNGASMGCLTSEFLQQEYSMNSSAESASGQCGGVDPSGQPTYLCNYDFDGGYSNGNANQPAHGTCFSNLEPTQYKWNSKKKFSELCSAWPPLKGMSVSLPDDLGVHSFFCYNAMNGCYGQRDCTGELNKGSNGVQLTFPTPQGDEGGEPGALQEILSQGCIQKQEQEIDVDKTSKMETLGDGTTSSIMKLDGDTCPYTSKMQPMWADGRPGTLGGPCPSGDVSGSCTNWAPAWCMYPPYSIPDDPTRSIDALGWENWCMTPQSMTGTYGCQMSKISWPYEIEATCGKNYPVPPSPKPFVHGGKDPNAQWPIDHTIQPVFPGWLTYPPRNYPLNEDNF